MAGRCVCRGSFLKYGGSRNIDDSNTAAALRASRAQVTVTTPLTHSSLHDFQAAEQGTGLPLTPQLFLKLLLPKCHQTPFRTSVKSLHAGLMASLWREVTRVQPPSLCLPGCTALFNKISGSFVNFS